MSPSIFALIEQSQQIKNATLWKFIVITTNSNCMNSKVCIGFAFSLNQCLPIIVLQVILHGNREQGHVFMCAGQYFILGSFLTVYDTVHFNYSSTGIVCGLNIAGR